MEGIQVDNDDINIPERAGIKKFQLEQIQYNK